MIQGKPMNIRHESFALINQSIKRWAPDAEDIKLTGSHTAGAGDLLTELAIPA